MATATGTAPFTYSWDGGITYSSTSTYTTTGSGTYCVTAMDATGCTSTGSTTLYVNNTAGVTISVTTPPTPPTCHDYCNGTATAEATGAADGLRETPKSRGVVCVTRSNRNTVPCPWPRSSDG